jgi:AcrR family transcriptional regulator
MATARQAPSYDRVRERRRAVALAHHFREAEGLSIAAIAERLGRSPATINAYFYDPTGEKARAVKARYVGVCRRRTTGRARTRVAVAASRSSDSAQTTGLPLSS